MNAHSHHAPPVGLPIETAPASATTSNFTARNHLFDFLAIVSGIGLFLGVSDVLGTGAISGLCLGVGAIFFGLAFMVKALQKAEAAEQS